MEGLETGAYTIVFADEVRQQMPQQWQMVSSWKVLAACLVLAGGRLDDLTAAHEFLSAVAAGWQKLAQ